MMTDEVYDIEAMKSLAGFVGGRIEYDMETPFITLDGKRQVVKSLRCDGFDCWTPRRSKRPGDEMTMWACNVNAAKAAAFLRGASKQEAEA
jgi:hypothetical protein